jgi:hypothetical protein
LFSYHPDEGVNLISGVLENLDVRPHLDLGFYNYGSVYFYLWQGAAAINRTYGLPLPVPSGAPDKPIEHSFPALILLGRLVSAILGTLTVPLLFALGNRLFGRAAGIWSGATYAVMPLAVIHAHFATVDVTATFFVCLALVFGARLLASDRWTDILLAGLSCGVAAATKYTCALVLLAPAIAILLGARKGVRTPYFTIPILVAASAAGFCLTCPGIFLNWPKFSHDFQFELQKSGQGMGLLFVDTAPGWIYHITNSLLYGLGLIPLIITIMAVILALIKRTGQDWYLLAFLLPYYLVVGAAQVKFARYMIPLFPVFAILIGRLAAEPSLFRPMLRKLCVGAAAASFLCAALMTLSFDRVLAGRDPRDETLRAFRIALLAPRGATIGFARLPWYDVPPFAPEFTAPQPGLRRRAAESLTEFRCRLPADNTELDLSVLERDSPDRVILSDLATEDWDRLHYKPWLDFKAVLDRRYIRGWQLEPAVWTGGFGLRKPAYLPNDILYVCPKISVYMLKPR